MPGITMNLLIESMTYIWLAIAFLFLLLEIGSPGLFFFISFFLSGLIAAIAAAMSFTFITQIAVFFVATIIALIGLRYLIVPFIEKNRPHERTNVYALQGKRGIAITAIYEKQLGMAKINGVTWAARSVQGSIDIKDEIEVIDIRGNHVIVKKIS